MCTPETARRWKKRFRPLSNEELAQEVASVTGGGVRGRKLAERAMRGEVRAAAGVLDALEGMGFESMGLEVAARWGKSANGCGT